MEPCEDKNRHSSECGCSRNDIMNLKSDLAAKQTRIEGLETELAGVNHDELTEHFKHVEAEKEVQILKSRIFELESSNLAQRKALKMLYDDTASYIINNNLGDVHHNRSMQMVRDALLSPSSPNSITEAIREAVEALHEARVFLTSVSERDTENYYRGKVELRAKFNNALALLRAILPGGKG